MNYFGLITVFMALMISGCGGTAPNPAPAPGATNPNPAPTTTPTPYPTPPIGGGNCSLSTSPGGLLSDRPYVGNLRSVFPHSFAGGTISLSLGFTQRYSFDSLIRSVEGQANISIRDGGTFVAQSAAQGADFCVRSIQPGEVNSREMSVKVTMVGPFSALAPTSSDQALVQIGGRADCTAYLYRGRIVGCIDVSLSHSILGMRYRFISQ